MKLLIDIQDSQVSSLKEILRDRFHAKARPVSKPDADLLEEIKEIKKAFKNAEKIKSGYLKGRPAEDLLNEL